MNIRSINILVIFFTLSNISFAQSTKDYFSQDETELYYGKVYYFKHYHSKGHPFFLNKDLLDASVEYNKKVYSGLSIRYDLLNQNIILSQTKYDELPEYISLNNSKLKQIEIITDQNNYTLKSFDDIVGLPKNIIFYEVLYEGNLKYIIGRYKSIKEELSVYNNDRVFVEITKHILIKEGKAFIFHNERDLCQIFGENKKEIKKYIKKEGIDFNLLDHQEIIRLLMYCESI